MTRKLKTLILVAMALGAFGAVNASGAQAAEEKFHCEIENCRFTLNTDGTGATAHHVFAVRNSIGESFTFTCESLTGEATSVAETTTELTVNTNLKYNNCKTVLGTMTTHFNGCHYNFTSAGGGTDKATVSIICPEGKKIEITNQTCTIKIPGSADGKNQSLTGIGYHSIVNGLGQKEVTVTAKVPGIAIEPSGQCLIDLTKTPITTEYTTGNTIVKGGQANDEKFHCEVENCKFTLKTDGTAATAHHVFVVKNKIGESISFTCESLTGEGMSEPKTATELTVNTNLQYDKCKSVLGAATVDMNGCHYNFTSAGGGTDKATVSIICPEGKKIEITNQTCLIKVGAQGSLAGIGYHTINSGLFKEVTVTAKVPGIASEPSGECGIDLTKTPITTEYTTGNTIVTAENSSGVVVDAWWNGCGVTVNAWWE